MTLDDIRATMTDPTVAPQGADANSPSGDMLRPFWVVVVNPRRQPPSLSSMPR